VPMRRAVTRRSGLALFLTIGVAVGASGCSGDGTPATRGSASAVPSAPAESTSPAPAPVPTPTVVRQPAAAAGGVCRLLTYGGVRQDLGVDFDVAAASGTAGASQTCVLQRIGAAVPDLTLSVTPARGVTPETFRESYVPARGVPRTGVGRTAYSAVIRSASTAGRVELGWLSTSGRVLTLVYTVDAAAAVSDRTVGQLANLARRVDAAR
jgi:hypothetical protein